MGLRLGWDTAGGEEAAWGGIVLFLLVETDDTVPSCVKTHRTEHICLHAFPSVSYTSLRVYVKKKEGGSVLQPLTLLRTHCISS